MIIGYKLGLDPDSVQEVYFNRACGVARFTYNWALGRYKEQYLKYKVSSLDEDKPNILKLKKEFNHIKRGKFPWVMDVTKCASARSFTNLQTAFSKFFSKKARYPKFRKRSRGNSFYIDSDKLSVLGDSVKVPKLGFVKLKESFTSKGKVMSGVVSTSGGKWFLSLNIDISGVPEEVSIFYERKLKNNPRLKDEIKVQNFKEIKSESIGIDLGIKTAIITSDGEEIQSPKPLKRYLKKLKRTQRQLSKKVKGSKNRLKAKKKLAKVHARVSNIRKDWVHKVTKYLCVNYKTIVLEDLAVKNLMRNHKLSKAIVDIGLGMFRQVLSYKVNYTCTTLKFIGRFVPSSKLCSSCGFKKEDLKLSDRVYKCGSCGLVIDRDFNASLNILKVGTQSY